MNHKVESSGLGHAVGIPGFPSTKHINISHNGLIDDEKARSHASSLDWQIDRRQKATQRLTVLEANPVIFGAN